MQSPSVTRNFSVLSCVFTFLLCSELPSQNTEVGVSPSLRQIQTLDKNERLTVSNHVVTELPAKKIPKYYPEVKGFVPATSQDELANLLSKIGANEDLFLYAVPNVVAREEATREKLDSHGWVQGLPLSSGHYSYLIRAHTTGEGIRFTEGRTDASWRQIDPIVFNDFSLTKGFALFALQFHPLHQTAAQFRYLGRQVLDNRQDYLVAFVQEPEHSQLAGRIMVNGREFPVAYQGIAWIDPDSFQIARMRIDLLKPTPEVGSQMTDIQFSEVRLPLVTKSLWLPRDVLVTRPTKDGAVREKHQFSDYRVFVTQPDVVPSTPSTEKPK